MRSKCPFISRLIGVILLLIGPIVLAQTGGLSVEALDANTKRPVESLLISIVSRDEATQQNLLTSNNGRVSFDSLAPGLYEITAAKNGYTTVIEASVRIVKQKTTSLKLSVRPIEQNLEEVLVVAKAIATEDTVNVNATRLDRESLRSAPGSGSDVLRALDGLPGLVSTDDFASFTVRGRGPQDNLILVDGIPFDQIVHFNQSVGEDDEIGAGGRYSIFAPNLIAGADFQPGGWGAKYSGRSGSLLNLEVAEGNRDTPSNSIRLDLAGLEYTYDGPSYIHEDTSILFSARHLDFGQFFETIGIDEIGSPVLTDVILKTNTELNADHRLKFLLIYAPEEFTRDIDNVLVLNDDDVIDDYLVIETEQDNALYGVTWEALVGDTGRLENRFYYRNTDTQSGQGEAFPDLVDPGTPADEIPVRNNILNIDEQEQEFGWRFDLLAENRFGQWSTGLSFAQIDLDFATFLVDDWNRFIYDQTDFRPDPSIKYITLTPESVDASFSASELNYGVYAEQTFDLSKWQVRTGLRYDYDGFADENLVSPRFGVTWNLTDSFALNSTAGIFYQSPRFITLARDPQNNTLQNEEVQQVSLGFKQQFNIDWSLLTEFYYQNLDNLVVANDRVTGEANNNGEGFSYGTDIVLSRRFTDRYSTNLSYSFNRSKLDDNDGFGEYDSDFQRPHALSLSGIWEINDRWKISGRWKFLSGKPDDSFIVNDNVLGDDEPLRFSKEIVGRNDERFDGYRTLNLRVDYRRSIGPADVIAFVDIINVLGSANPNSADFNDRTGQESVEDGDSFPLVGLRFEF